MRVIGNTRYSQRASKRRIEIDSSGAYESRPKRTPKKNEGEHKVDRFCWVCHTEANDKVCVICHRAYHNRCLNKTATSFSELGVCPECQSKSVVGTELPSNRYFNLDKLKRMLDVLTRRSFGKKRGRNKKLLRWPEEDRDKLFKIIDFEILLDNINHVLPYTKTAEFYGDVKFLCHNAFIVYGANSDETKAAEHLRRDFKSELLDLEACPECYYYLYCDESDQDSFVRLCDSPHDIVWAQLTGHPYWPAKCLKVVKDIAHVRFFGEHEQSNIPINKCYYISESHPKDKSNLNSLTNSGPKSQHYKSAKSELLKYIHLYRRKYGDFQFYPHKTPYKPPEKVNKASILPTEGYSNRKEAQMKLEGIVNEDSEINLINAATAMEYSEDSLTNDITSPNGNLNTNASAITSINMTFSADENHLNLESVNPVVSSLGSLPSITSTTGTETVHSSGILSAVAANDASNDSSVQIDSLNNIVNNYSVYTENHSEVDNDVHYIGQQKNVEDYSFNPDVVLPVIMQENPDLKPLVQKARYLTDGMVIHLWASFCKQNGHIGTLSRLSVQLRKCNSELITLKIEKEDLMKENENLILNIEQRDATIDKLNAEINNLKEDIRKGKKNNDEVTTNAKNIINSLQSGRKETEKSLKAEYMCIVKEKEDIIAETEQQLQKVNNTVNNLEEENRKLKEELEEVSKAKQSVESKLNYTNTIISPEKIRKYKISHYCYVCEKEAAFVCCLKASYCGSDCQAKHAMDHRKYCSKNDSGGSIIQQTETMVYVRKSKDLITTGKSVTSSSANPKTPDTHTVTSYTHHKKAEIQRVAATPYCPSPPEPTDNNPGPSFRTHSSKSRRRYY